MIIAEQVPVRRRLQIFDDQVRPDALARDLHENLHEDDDRWISDFIANLAGVLRNIGRRK